MKMYRTLVASMLVLALSTPVAIAEDSALAMVKPLGVEYDKRINAHDTKLLADLFAKDAILVPAPAPGGTGREAVMKFFAGTALSNHVVEPVVARQIAPNVIVSLCHWSADFKDKAGKVNPIHGDATLTYEKLGDDWKIAVLSFNSLPEK
jgi:ketosteroid isomerase-like protein